MSYIKTSLGALLISFGLAGNAAAQDNTSVPHISEFNQGENFYGTPCLIPNEIWGEALDLLHGVQFEKIMDERGLVSERLVCSESATLLPPLPK